MSRKKERFGRYLILDHLVDGGMAKICRARFLGEQADKIVAIKMVQPQYSKDESFKQMFMNEIKVTFGLLHPNIVQTYDYGFHKDQLFVAMEYCDGRNLKEYLDRLRQKKFVFPVEICVYIISQVCQGLNYAHSYTDKLTGKAAHIIHRDISPHNVMLTYDGAVKVIDFGIAKANTNSEATQAGTIKGKLSYLAPEYLDGQELDHKYDQFAVGITLWEMLCSRKLFKAANDLAVLKKIQECKVPPPSSINPNVPKELDDIVLKSLAKNREERFDNMDQLNRALIKFLYANYPDFNSSDLSYFAKELFKDEIKKDREKLFEYGKIDIKPYIEDMNKENQTGTVSVEERSERRVEQVLDFGFSNNAGITPAISSKKKAVNTFKEPLNRPSKENSFSQAGKRKRGAHNRSYTKATDVSKVELEDNKTAMKEFLKVCSFICLILAGAWFLGGDKIEKVASKFLPFVSHKVQEIVVKKIDNKKDEDVSTQKSLDSETKSSSVTQSDTTAAMKVRLENFDKYRQKVFVNNKLVKPDLFNSFRIKPNSENESYFVRVEEPGLKHFITEVPLSNLQDKDSLVLEVPKMEPTSFGYLYSSGCRVSGTITFQLWGEVREESVPIRSSLGVAFPVVTDESRSLASEKELEIKFHSSSSKLEENSQVFKVDFNKEGQRVNLCDLLNL